MRHRFSAGSLASMFGNHAAVFPSPAINIITTGGNPQAERKALSESDRSDGEAVSYARINRMHFFQLVAAWLFPCAVCAAAVTAEEGATEHSSSSSSLPAFGVKVGAADPGSSSPSDVSTASSSPPSSVLGARSSSSNSARSPDKQVAATEAAKGDVVRRCMRRFARHLQRANDDAGAGDREQAPRRRKKTKSGRPTKPPLAPAATRISGDAVDGTAREREEAVASAIAYCMQTARRPGISTSTLTPPSPAWRLDRPEEGETTGTVSAPAQCKCKDITREEPPSRRRGASSDDLLGRQQNAAAGGNSSVTPERSGESSVPAAAQTGRTSRRGPAGAGECLPGTRGGSSSSSFNELELDALRITSYFTAKYTQCNLD